MGKRSGTETVVEIVLAFLGQRTWTQAALARRVGVSPESLRRRLHEMMASGIPLERQQDTPHVYWSVPRRWFPGGVVLRADDAEELLRQLARAPRTKRRDELMARVVEAAKGKAAAVDAGAVVAPHATEAEESFMSVVEDSASMRRALGMRYFSASGGAVERRHVSVHRVMAGTPARFVGTCHRDGRLKWFRVENVVSAQLDDGVKFVEASSEQVDGFVRESVDGFHQGTAAEELRFWVRDPEARWVAGNLLEGMTSERRDGGIVVSVTSSAPMVVARYVVGLGGAAGAETMLLRRMVEELARGALDRCSATSNEGRG